MALHGGIVPYGGTFLVFTDYCRPAIRLSALMGQRVIYVMTHDSIGLGEDGPTHQPVEHLAALRAMPNLNVFRPADRDRDGGVLGAGAGNASDTPSILALTRQAVPALRTRHGGENLCAKGAYVLAEADGGKRDVTILGDRLGGRRSPWRRASCWPRTACRRPSCRCPAGNCSRRSPLPIARRCWARRRASAVEAARRLRLGALARAMAARFIGMEGFGASAPAAQALRAFRHHAGQGCRSGAEAAQAER